MKKNKLLIIAIALIFILLFIFAFAKNKSKDENQISANDIKIIEKCEFKSIDNDWIYYMCIDYKKDSNRDVLSGTFGGINMKYSSLSDHYIEILDEKSKNVIGKMQTNYVSLANGEATRNDARSINVFLEEKKFNREINMDDLESLDITTIKKETIVEMYNKAYNSNEKTVGKYINKSFAGSVISNYNSGYCFQMIYIIDYGNVGKIHIEIMDEKGTLLSDKKNLTDLEKKLLGIVSEVEKRIITNNSFTSGIYEDKSFYDFSNLNNMLIEFEKTE